VQPYRANSFFNNVGLEANEEQATEGERPKVCYELVQLFFVTSLRSPPQKAELSKRTLCHEAPLQEAGACKQCDTFLASTLAYIVSAAQ